MSDIFIVGKRKYRKNFLTMTFASDYAKTLLKKAKNRVVPIWKSGIIVAVVTNDINLHKELKKITGAS